VSTLDETAARLGTSARYVRRLVEQKRLSLARSSGAAIVLDPGSIDAFEQTRQTPGRPRKITTRDALARELLSQPNPGISPRTLARIRQELSRFTQSELAERLRSSSDPALSALATLALSAPTYLAQKRAQKVLRDLHAAWAATRFPRGRRSRQLALTDIATTSSAAAAARVAIRDDNRDLAFRLIVDHVAVLAAQESEQIAALMTRPSSTGDVALDALLHAGVAWVASTHGVPLPAWSRPIHLPKFWNPTGRTVILENALPQFLDANIYCEARDMGVA